MFEPAIKWSGSKRKIASEIIECFPKEIDTYYEPFCGGCHVLRRLLATPDIRVNKYICSDLNKGLIDLWIEIRDNPDKLYSHYKELWEKLNQENRTINWKCQYFVEIRDRYNKEHNPADFLFIMRTTTNGMPRYNRKGEFNNSFHISRPGILPETLYSILLEWSEVLQNNQVEFKHQDYTNIQSNLGDLLYLDPPYFHTKGMYFGSIDMDVFYDWLRKQKGTYLWSFDGVSGKDDKTCEVPQDLYTEHKYLNAGKSSFKKYLGKKESRNSVVMESLYIKEIK